MTIQHGSRALRAGLAATGVSAALLVSGCTGSAAAIGAASTTASSSSTSPGGAAPTTSPATSPTTPPTTSATAPAPTASPRATTPVATRTTAPRATASPTRPGVQSFYGYWSLHGENMTFRPDGTGVVSSRDYVEDTDGGWVYSEETVRTLLSPDGRVLTVTITGQRHVTRLQDGTSHPYRGKPRDPSAVGTVVELRFVAHDLIRARTVKGAGGLGDPYICGDAPVSARPSPCGA